MLGHLDAFKKAKNPSLAQSPKVKELHLKVKEAVQAPEEEPAADEMFEGDNKGEGKGNKKKEKASLHHAPGSVFITLKDSQIEVKTPSSWKESDLILEDVSCCLEAKGLTSRVANSRKGPRRLSDLKNEVEKMLLR